MLFAAGLGTRLRPITDSRPKALAEVAGKTLLEWNIRYLQQAGIRDVVINVHHFAEMVIDILDKNQGFGSSITISDEKEEILETGGGVKKALMYFEDVEDFVVMNVDILTDLDLYEMIATHEESGADATLAVMRRDTTRYLLFDEQRELCGWRNIKTGEERAPKNVDNAYPLAFSGIQIMSPQIFEDSALKGKFSLIDLYLEQCTRKKIMGYDHSENLFLDVGKPESLAQAAVLLERLGW